MKPNIYFEKQDSSLLCAQHALNNLLQGYYFEPSILGDISNSLNISNTIQDNEFSHSNEYGFFSLSVIEVALSNLSLSIRYMKKASYLNNSDYFKTLEGIIVHKKDHWFSIRKIGSEWVVLDSLKDSPIWINNIIEYINNIIDQKPSLYMVYGDYPLPEIKKDTMSIRELRIHKYGI
eukprot:GHVP01047423.1.p1 GENE.GHVP01047423.1~~GHVP01047423.1.p1  ORF type:complete len:177 (+),score=19.19 GHVP01047423.1:431-961(+)